MISVSIIGYGNVGQQLAHSFHSSENANLVQVYNRSQILPSSLPSELFINDLGQLKPADIYIISVSDRSVVEIASKLPFTDRLVVHTAGSLVFDALPDTNRRGVFYPLQTFSRSKSVDFSGLPVFVEAENEADIALLESAAKALKARVFEIDTNQRKALHVSAVFACNFSNHMYKIADDICKANNIPFDALHPLILETAQKIMSLSPSEAQTGPAIRRDEPTISAHLDFINDASKKELYELLTRSIQNG
ncbi:Rossmann-like and DUF2520 domain-containing protein [Flavobacterium silvaticum]|uniref:DUF2520 domain-containing protein n=1 Tax=Flavobacterium silvaticum TaxID=1852020 RepID=A0A972FPB7_9FLAO|nr:DUF2520 domain-containing protein [Flavobacterium silvaticum]NMH28930.1 DUF2520 domain-containing protein [Flavobacterium silvaticum]